jgi:hypothetical protein
VLFENSEVIMTNSYIKSALFGAAVAFSLIQLPACQNTSGNGASARAVKFKEGLAQGKAKPGAVDSKTKVDGTAGNTTVGAAKTPEDKQVAWLNLNMELLNQSHQFFREAWRIAVKDKQAVKTSVFEQVLNAIKASTPETDRQCTGFKGDLKPQVVILKKSEADVPLQMKVITADCNGKEANWLAYAWMYSAYRIRMVFNPVALSAGAGERLTSLAQGNKDRYVDCYIDFTPNERVTGLSCLRLGQSEGKKHLEFDSFVFNAFDTYVLTFKATPYGSDFLKPDLSQGIKTVNVPKDTQKSILFKEDFGNQKVTDVKTDGMKVDPKGPLFEPDRVDSNNKDQTYGSGQEGTSTPDGLETDLQRNSTENATPKAEKPVQGDENTDKKVEENKNSSADNNQEQGAPAPTPATVNE